MTNTKQANVLIKVDPKIYLFSDDTPCLKLTCKCLAAPCKTSSVISDNKSGSKLQFRHFKKYNRQYSVCKREKVNHHFTLPEINAAIFYT